MYLNTNILKGMSIFSHCGENFFSKACEYVENIETHIALCIIPIQIDTDMSLTL